MIAALFLALFAAAPPSTAALGRFELDLSEKNGEYVCTLHAKDAPIEDILSEVAQKTFRKLEGLEDTKKLGTVSAELEDRPLVHTLHTLLGSVGLRARINSTSIQILPDLDDRADAELFDDQAELLYLRALKAFPESEEAARAELALAEIQLRRENDAAALSHYQALARRHVESPLAPEALFQAGTILERMGEWRVALTTFTTLANLVQPHAYAARARLELARCMAHNDDPRQALFMLDGLEHVFPSPDERERQARLYVRARALVGIGNHGEALRALEAAEKIGDERTLAPDAMELRAEALEHFGRTSEAARAWLAFARDARGADRRRAFVEAARLSAAAHDWIAVLMIQKHAGAPVAIEPYARDAREALGVPASVAASLPVAQELDAAEEQIANGSHRTALGACERLYRMRASFADEDVTRLALAYARALDSEKGLEPALEVLREIVRTQKNLENRRALYLLAAELFENRGMFDEAIAAYRGEL